VETVAWLTAQFSDLRMELESVVAEDDIVVARVVTVARTSVRSMVGLPRQEGIRRESKSLIPVRRWQVV
jgi:hypothetical protein